VVTRALGREPSALPPMRVQSAARRSPSSRARQRGGMRGGRAGWHQPGCRVRYVRATPLASIPYSPCQTAHPPSLKLRRASKQARHSLGVGGQSSSFPRRVAVRGFFSCRFASHLPPQLRGGRAPEAGHWHVRRACEARRLASRATGGRLSALQVAIFGRATSASSSGSAHRNQRRDFAHDQAFTPGRSGPAPPVTAVRSAASGRHSPAPPSGHLPRRPS
jgi:hypothetical protein